jgi:hypothetical protein
LGHRWIIPSLAFLLVTAVGCGGKDKRATDLSRRLIRSGDGLYAQRVSVGKLDQAIQWYLSGEREFPESAKMKGRLARAYVARSYGHEASGVEGYATARRFGLGCLKTEVAFGGLVSSAGGEITPKAIATLEEDRIGCLTWTSIAWSRWLAERDVVGAGIDLGATIALARRAVELKPNYDGGRPYAALGLALALAPKPLKPRLGASREALKKAIELSPTRLTPVVDLAEFVSAPQRRAQEWSRLLQQVANTELSAEDPDWLENQAAIARATALLMKGPSDRWLD